MTSMAWQQGKKTRQTEEEVGRQHQGMDRETSGKGTVSIGGRTITNLRFADDIDGLAGEEEELAKLVERLDEAPTAYGMEISAEKTKLMTNNTSGINTEIKVNEQKLECHKLQVPGLSYN